jgi:thiamine transport system permease protein
LGGSLANALWYSASVALQATVITLLITALVVSARAKWLNDLVTVPLGISSVILGFGFLITFGAAFWVLPIAQALVALPMVVWTVSPILDRLEPKLFEVATMLQVGKWRKFKTIALPVLQRAVLVGAGFAFAISLGEFGASSFLIRPNQPTLPVAIYRLFGVPGHNNYQLAVLGALSLLVVTVLFSIVVAQSARQGFMRWGCRPLSNSIPRKPSPRSASSLFVLPGFRENHTCDIRSQINNQANPLSYRDTGQ